MEHQDKAKSKLTTALALTPFIVAIFIAIIFHISNPFMIGPAGILAVFLLFYILFVSIIFILLRQTLRFIDRSKDQGMMSHRKAYYLALVIAFVPVLLLALNTIGQLRILDVALVLLLAAVTGFYVLRRTA